MTCTAINSQYGQLKPAQVRFAAFLALRWYQWRVRCRLPSPPLSWLPVGCRCEFCEPLDMRVSFRASVAGSLGDDGFQFG